MKITQDNYKNLIPGEIADALANNSATIIAGSFEIFKDIFTAIHEAIQQGGHFRKDVRSFINLQKQWNEAVEKELAALKAAK